MREGFEWQIVIMSLTDCTRQMRREQKEDRLKIYSKPSSWLSDRVHVSSSFRSFPHSFCFILYRQRRLIAMNFPTHISCLLIIAIVFFQPTDQVNLFRRKQTGSFSLLVSSLKTWTYRIWCTSRSEFEKHFWWLIDVFLVDQFYCRYLFIWQERCAYPNSLWSNIRIGIGGCK